MMNIDFWSDIVCPWCGLMDHRLRLAIGQAPFGSQAKVRHRSFQLHPNLPREGISQRDLFTRAGLPQSAVPTMLRPIEQAAEAEGLTPYRAIDRTLGPTDYAHELLAHSATKGRGDQAWHAMFRAHFGQARKLWTAAEVLELAAEIGLDQHEAAAVLGDRRYRARVQADQREGQRLGAHGTPFLVIDGRYAIPGAISTSALLDALGTAWEEGHQAPSPLTVFAAPTDTCTPDGCVVQDRQAPSS
ncbi:MAG TPA: DsbA family oxidoreductase [Trebonia sp.]|nr:DsbA family oxidoreductase [Trebonia sp.]